MNSTLKTLICFADNSQDIAVSDINTKVAQVYASHLCLHRNILCLSSLFIAFCFVPRHASFVSAYLTYNFFSMGILMIEIEELKRNGICLFHDYEDRIGKWVLY